jgi:hypothetical protein
MKPGLSEIFGQPGFFVAFDRISVSSAASVREKRAAKTTAVRDAMPSGSAIH